MIFGYSRIAEGEKALLKRNGKSRHCGQKKKFCWSGNGGVRPGWNHCLRQ